MTQHAQLFTAMDEIISSLGLETTKRASDTSNGGPTSFPSVEDPNKKPLQTGSQYADNTAEVDKQNKGQTVQEAAEPSPTQDRQREVNTGDGITLSAVGEDPAVEQNYKGSIKDPGTSSPARVDDGVKYGSMPMADLLKLAGSLSTNILASMAGVSPTKAAATAPNQAMAAGYQAAAAAGLQKDAAASAEDFMQATINDAILEADLFAQEWFKFAKQAADDAPPDDAAAAGGPPPGDAGMTSAAPPPGPGPEAPPGPGAGGPPGMDPGALLGDGGADPGAASLAASQPGPEEAMQELVSAMSEKGISPEMLLEIIQNLDTGGGGDAGGGMAAPGAEAPGLAGGGQPPMPPEGGAPPAGGPSPMGDKMAKVRANREKLASVALQAKAFQQAGKFKFLPAKTARTAALRNMMSGYIDELARSAGLKI